MFNKVLPLVALIAAPVAAQTAPAAQQAPQPLAKAAFLQRVDASFTSADANKDGFWDRSEIEAGQTRELTQAKAQTIAGRERAFRQLDANKDGNLSLTEFNAVVAAQALPKADAAPVISLLDTNKDGRVSKDESRAPNAAQFDRADTNKDGSLSVEEQRAAAANRR